MARESLNELEDCGPVARGLEALGVGLLLAGAGVSLAAIFGVSAIAGLWYGAMLSVIGLAGRAAANAVGAYVIEHRGVRVPEPRLGRDGRPATEPELVEQFEQDMAAQSPGYVARLKEQQERTEAGKDR